MSSVRGHCASSVQGRSAPTIFWIKSPSSRFTRESCISHTFFGIKAARPPWGSTWRRFAAWKDAPSLARRAPLQCVLSGGPYTVWSRVRHVQAVWPPPGPRHAWTHQHRAGSEDVPVGAAVRWVSDPLFRSRIRSPTAAIGLCISCPSCYPYLNKNWAPPRGWSPGRPTPRVDVPYLDVRSCCPKPSRRSSPSPTRARHRPPR